MTVLGAHPATGRGADEVWHCLARVADPELDEPITEMGFVEAVRVSDAGHVEVAFRLPTYWCSPNFAFLMADGIRREVGALDWVAGVRVTLRDHLYAAEMNAGVNAGRSFPEIFSDLAGGEDLDALRLTFRRKAFMKRQEAVLLRLRKAGVDDGAVVSMTLGALEAVPAGPDGARERRRYREILAACGLDAGDGAPAFPTPAGEVLDAARLGDHLAELRAVRIGMEFNGALCRGLQRARYREASREAAGPARAVPRRA